MFPPVVGMYVKMVGHDCAPAPVADTNWMLANCWGWSVLIMAAAVAPFPSGSALPPLLVACVS